MGRKLVYLLAFVLIAPGAYALGLGNIERKSALNEPFNATIKIVDASAEELDSLKVKLADVERFQRAGLERSEALSQLRFEVVQSGGGTAYIKVTSQQPIREPFLNLLLEASWSKGRVFREYTVLLDPPLYDPSARITRQTPVPADSPRSGTTPLDTPAALAQKGGGADTKPRRERQPSAPGTYGPTDGGDTLSEIAVQLRPTRSVSLDQVMLALLRANPEAFFQDNVNALKKGYVLRLPEVTAIKSIPKAEAIAQVQKHHALWEQYRLAIVGSPTPRPIGASPGAQADIAVQDGSLALKQDDAHLKLVSPSGEGAGAVPTAPGASTDQAINKLRNELSLVKEELEAKRQENAELNAKLMEADDLIKLLQRKLEVKDDEFAALQAKVGAEQPPASAGINPPVPGSQPQSQPAAEPAQIQATGPQPDKGETSKSLFETVPGGTITVVLAILVLALVALSIVRIQRRQKAETPLIKAKTRLKEPPLPAFANERGEQQTPIPVLDLEQREPVFEALEDQSPAIKSAASSQPLEMLEVVEAEKEAVASLQEEGSDPLAEVNIYLAYERFDQAAEVVKQAIEEHPDKHEYKLRLLEVYYAANDKSAYEEQARILHDAVEGHGPLWESALAMWREMSPGRSLFAKRAEEGSLQAQGASMQFIDITGASETLEIPVASADITGAGKTLGIPISGAALGAASKAISGLDLDLGAGLEPQGEGEIDKTTDDLFDLTPASEGKWDKELFDVKGSGIESSLPAGPDMDDISHGGSRRWDDKDVFEISMADINSSLELAFPNVPDTGDMSLSDQGERSLNLTDSRSSSGNGDDFTDFSVSYEDEGDIFDLTGDGDKWPESANSFANDLDLGLDWDVSGQRHEHEVGLGKDEGEIKTDARVEAVEHQEIEHKVEEPPYDTGELIKAGSPGEGSATEKALSFDAGLDGGETKDLVSMVQSLSTEESKTLEEFQRLFDEPVKPDNLLNEEQGAVNDFDVGSGIEILESVGQELDKGEEGIAGDPEDETEVKLNLAKAYMELGDVEGARSVLNEVTLDGSESQKKEAQELMNQFLGGEGG